MSGEGQRSKRKACSRMRASVHVPERVALIPIACEDSSRVRSGVEKQGMNSVVYAREFASAYVYAYHSRSTRTTHFGEEKKRKEFAQACL